MAFFFKGKAKFLKMELFTQDIYLMMLVKSKHMIGVY